MSLLTNPASARKRDTYVSLDLNRILCDPPQQPCTSPLGHLAVLLLAPLVLATELGAGLAHELACQHEPLIVRELVRETNDAAQVVAQEDQMLDVSACVGHIYPTASAADNRE